MHWKFQLIQIFKFILSATCFINNYFVEELQTWKAYGFFSKTEDEAFEAMKQQKCLLEESRIMKR